MFSKKNKTQSRLPDTWNEPLLAREISQLRTQPPNIVAHFLSSVQDRFIIGQDYQTAHKRTLYVQEKIKQLGLTKEYQQLIDDFEFHGLEKEIRRRELELKRKDLENRQQRQQELDELKHQQETLKLHVENERLTDELEALKKPPKEESPLTEAQQLVLRRAELVEQLDTLNKAEDKALQSARNEDERTHVQNVFTDRRNSLLEELAKS